MRKQNAMNNLRLPALLGSAALLALLARPVAPALAQGAPDQLRYLVDPPKPEDTVTAKLTEDQRTKVRNAYARVHFKKTAAHQ